MCQQREYCLIKKDSNIMKEKVLICYILFGCLFFNSCGTKRDNNSFSFNENRVNEVEAIKFMNTVNEYPIAIYEKTFWQYREEHAKLLIKNSGAALPSLYFFTTKILKYGKLVQQYGPIFRHSFSTQKS